MTPKDTVIDYGLAQCSNHAALAVRALLPKKVQLLMFAAPVCKPAPLLPSFFTKAELVIVGAAEEFVFHRRYSTSSG